MAALTWRLANVAVSTFGELIEVDQAAANTGTSWTVAKTGSGNDSNMVWGTLGTTGFSLESSTPKPSAAPGSGNAFRTAIPYSGTFDAAAWAMNFAVRATVASSQSIRLRVRVYRSANPSGAGAVELTSATQVGTATGGIGVTGTF